MKCEKCGHETIADVKYCPGCGEEMPAPETPAEAPATEAQTPPGSVEAAATSAVPSSIITTPVPGAEVPEQEPQPAPEPAPVTPPAPTPVTPAAAAPAATPADEPEKPKKTWCIVGCVGCGCLTIVAIIVAAVWLMLAKGAEEFDEQVNRTTIDDDLTINLDSDSSWDEDGEYIPDGDAGGEYILTDDFEITFPAGWERQDDGSASHVVIVGRDADNGDELQVGLYAEIIEEGTSLEAWSDGALEEFADLDWEVDSYDGVDLCDQRARQVIYQDPDEGADIAIILTVYKNKGFMVVLGCPLDTMGEHAETLKAAVADLTIMA